MNTFQDDHMSSSKKPAKRKEEESDNDKENKSLQKRNTDLLRP